MYIVGEFSPAQREVYEALLEVQEACLRLVYPGSLTLNDIYSEMLLMLGRQLQRLNVIPKNLGSTNLQKVRYYYRNYYYCEIIHELQKYIG